MPVGGHECAVHMRRILSRALLPLLVGLTLIAAGAAAAQELKQIKLTEKQVQGFITAHADLMKIYKGANPAKPDPKLEAQAQAVVRKNGFANLDDHEIVSMNISMIMAGIDLQTKTFAEPPEQIKQEIAALKADRTVPEREKKAALAQLELELKNAKPIQFRENIALVLKHFDKLQPIMQDGPVN
jgi:hypothetical protein